MALTKAMIVDGIHEQLGLADSGNFVSKKRMNAADETLPPETICYWIDAEW